MLATFLIVLREGLEAALVVGILIAYLARLDRRDVLPRLWAGVGLAVLLSLVVGAVLTFGSYALTFEAQEILGGGLSLLAVAMVTWMIFWMQQTGRRMKASLEGEIDRALAQGGLWTLVAIGFVSVAREGVETTLLLWSMVQSFGFGPQALLGALLGLLCAVLLGWFIARGAVRLDLRRFFTWTGGALAAVLQAVVGFTPAMTWLQVIAWAGYIVVVGAFFVRGALRARPRTSPQPAPTASRPMIPHTTKHQEAS